ncbi:hypothetical protein Tco_0280074, partial [Tanacetum coccineum]
MDFIRETILVPVGKELVSVRVSEFDGEIKSLLNGYTVASSSDGEDSNDDVSGGDSNDDDDGNENDGGSGNNYGEQVAISGISGDATTPGTSDTFPKPFSNENTNPVRLGGQNSSCECAETYFEERSSPFICVDANEKRQD